MPRSGSSSVPAELLADLDLLLIKFCVARGCVFVVWRSGACRSVWLCCWVRTLDQMDGKKIEIKSPWLAVRMKFEQTINQKWTGSPVGKATDYRLEAPGNRIPVRVRFFAHIQTGPWFHPAFCTMGTVFPLWVNRPGRDTYHTLFLASRTRKCRAITLLTLWACSGM
jgi:hypothetical protein